MPELMPVMNLAEITLVPSYKCTSANCEGCYKKALRSYAASHHEEIDLDALLAFLRSYVCTVQVHSIGITGGEFTEYRGCCDLVERLTHDFPGIALEIVTNGQDHATIARLIEAAGFRDDLIIQFSIDGFGAVCDKLRGKKGYFDEVMKSIEVMAEHGLASSLRVGCRYYPEHAASIDELARHLERCYGIARSALALGTVTYRVVGTDDAAHYIDAMWAFAREFWPKASDITVPHTPSHLMKGKPYASHQQTSSCCPAVQPDGYVYTCDTQHGQRVGHIRDADVAQLIANLVRVGKNNAAQCDSCQYGQCVKEHYARFGSGPSRT